MIFVISFFIATLKTVTSKKIALPNSDFSITDFSQEFQGIATVIDGDSLKVKNQNNEYEVRLFGIDAPEFSQTCFDNKDKEYDCGKISRNFLIKLANKKTVACFYSQKDVYNRFLAICKIDQLVINEEIIKNGMAIIYNLKQADEKLINLEKLAQENKLGIWQGKFQTPKNYRKYNSKK